MHHHICRLVWQRQASRAGTSNYIPQILWDVISCRSLDTCFWHTSPHMYLCSITTASTASKCFKIILKPTQPPPFICFSPWNGLWYFQTYILTHCCSLAIMQQQSTSQLAITMLSCSFMFELFLNQWHFFVLWNITKINLHQNFEYYKMFVFSHRCA